MSTLQERRRESKREVKPVDRFTDSTFEKEIIPGDGKKLSEIPEIVSTMKGLKKANDMIIKIHRIFFGTQGTLDSRKKDVMSFSGLKGKDQDETDEIVEKKTQQLLKMKASDLVELCRLFCIAAASKTLQKEKYVDELIKFITKPGSVKVVVTEKDKVAQIEDEEEEEEVEEKKPKKTAAKKETKKAAPKKQTKKASQKKETKKAAPKKEEKKPAAEKKEKKPKKAASEKKEEKKPAKKEAKK